MLLSRVNFGQAVKLGPSTQTSIDIGRPEFKSFQIEFVPDLNVIKITPPIGAVVLVPMGNVASCEVRQDVTRSESSKTPDGTRQEGKGKARTA
jgi:hypothetical protein